MISAAKWESSLPEPPKARLSERETPRDKLKHPKVLGARTASKQGVPGQDVSHRKIPWGSGKQIQGCGRGGYIQVRENGSTQESVWQKPQASSSSHPRTNHSLILNNSFHSLCTQPGNKSKRRIFLQQNPMAPPFFLFSQATSTGHVEKTVMGRGWSSGKEVTVAARSSVTGIRKPARPWWGSEGQEGLGKPFSHIRDDSQPSVASLASSCR